MTIRSLVARSAAVTAALLVAAVASPSALAEPNMELSVEFENGEYQPTVGNIDLAAPRYTNEDEAELIEEFDTRLGAVKSLSFSRGVGAMPQRPSKQVDDDSERNPGVTLEDGTFYTDDSVESDVPLFTKPATIADSLSEEDLTPTLSLVSDGSTIVASWEAMDSPERNFWLEIDGKILVDGHGSTARAELPLNSISPESDIRLTLEDSTGNLPTEVKTLSASAILPGMSPVQARGFQENSTAYLHTTFIPESRVGVSAIEGLGCGETPNREISFSGDNRSCFLPTMDFPLTHGSAPSFRTLAFVFVNWQNPDSYKIEPMLGVGPTSKYVNGKLTETRRASASGIRLVNPGASSNYAEFRVDHDVANPFCSVGSIRYTEQVRMYRSTGLVEVIGWRQAAPAHEIYARRDLSNGNQQWKTMSRRSNEGFICLVQDACDLDEYALSQI